MNRSKFMRFGMCNHKLRKGRYTLYLKFKKHDIPNTHISAEIYRIPDLKSPCIPYTQKPWPTLRSFRKRILRGRSEIHRSKYKQGRLHKSLKATRVAILLYVIFFVAVPSLHAWFLFCIFIYAHLARAKRIVTF